VITISSKTGLPIVQEKSEMNKNKTDDQMINKGTGRNKKETPEEKRLRKQLIKEERRNNRQIKTKLKSAYKEDDMIQQKTSNTGGNGVPVFKY